MRSLLIFGRNSDLFMWSLLLSSIFYGSSICESQRFSENFIGSRGTPSCFYISPLRGGSVEVYQDWKERLARLEKENEILRQENKILVASREVKASAQKTMHSFLYRRKNITQTKIAEDIAGKSAANFSNALLSLNSCNEDSYLFDCSESESVVTREFDDSTIQTIMQETDRMLFQSQTSVHSSMSSASPPLIHMPEISDTDRELMRMRDTSRSCAADRSKFVGCRIAPAGGLSIPNALRRGRRRLILLPGTHRLPRAIRITANATFLGGSAASGPTAAVPAPPAAAPRVCGRWAFAGGEGALTRLALDNPGGPCVRIDGGCWRLDACSVRAADFAPLPGARHALSTALCCSGCGRHRWRTAHLTAQKTRMHACTQWRVHTQMRAGLHARERARTHTRTKIQTAHAHAHAPRTFAQCARAYHTARARARARSSSTDRRDADVTADWTAVGGLGPDRPAAWGLFACGAARAALRGCILELCEESAAAAVA